MNVTIPRLDDQRTNYLASVSRYTASKGQLMAIDDVTGDHVQLIDAEGARQMRAAAMLADRVPYAQLEPIGLGGFILDPGIFPVQEPVLDLQKGLWSDPNALLFEYSSMRERYRTRDLIRQTESEV